MTTSLKMTEQNRLTILTMYETLTASKARCDALLAFPDALKDTFVVCFLSKQGANPTFLRVVGRHPLNGRDLYNRSGDALITQRLPRDRAIRFIKENRLTDEAIALPLLTALEMEQAQLARLIATLVEAGIKE